MADNKATYDRMVQMASAFEAQRDKRVIFLQCYAMMTANMRAALAAGEFHNPAWVASWIDNFAAYYFNALEAYTQRPETAPRIWRLTHELTGMPPTSAIEDLLLGVNAHINGDLPLVLRDALAPDWATLTPEQRELRYQDHTHVNAVIGRTMDSVRSEVVEKYSHLVCEVAHVCFPAVELAEWELSQIIAAWRDEVWERAVRLVEDDSVLDQEFLRYDIERDAIHRVRILVSELEMRERLLAAPSDELHRLHPNPPYPQQVLGKRSAQRLAESQRSANALPPHEPPNVGGTPTPPVTPVTEEARLVRAGDGKRKRWFWK